MPVTYCEYTVLGSLGACGVPRDRASLCVGSTLCVSLPLPHLFIFIPAHRARIFYTHRATPVRPARVPRDCVWFFGLLERNFQERCRACAGARRRWALRFAVACALPLVARAVCALCRCRIHHTHKHKKTLFDSTRAAFCEKTATDTAQPTRAVCRRAPAKSMC